MSPHEWDTPDTAAIRAGTHTLGHVAELCDALDAARAEIARLTRDVEMWRLMYEKAAAERRTAQEENEQLLAALRQATGGGS